MVRLAVIVSLLVWCPLLRAAEPEPPRYVCRPLIEGIEDLREQGLKVIYSSELVAPEMQIKEEPSPDAGRRRILEELLRPHGLRAVDGAGGILLVVRDAGADGGRLRRAAREPETVPGLLPEWVDLLSLDGELAERPLPSEAGTEDEVPASARYLVLRLGDELSRDAERAAFDLKERIVAARSRAPRLRVALEGAPATLEAVVDRSLAPYVDAYTYRDERFVPGADPTARLWWRTPAADSEVLARLVTAGERGDELVVVEGHAIDAVHQAFLRRIQSTSAGHPIRQPLVQGIAAERVRFFVDPDSGDYYLAVYAEPGRRQSILFDVDQTLAAQSLFPTESPWALKNFAHGAEIIVDGSYPYYYFFLEAQDPEVLAGGLTVEARRIVDPYEEVVKNQVFQERETEKYRSLDVMEYLTVTPQREGGDQILWEHRILRREGRLAEYHHLGLSRNGVREPEEKLLKGRIFRNEALLQLQPLEIELDETYRYELLGAETVDGYPTWKIRFEPLKKGTAEDGTFVSGIVWLDQETHAHRRMKTFQVGLDNSLISQERTLHYGWIPSGGECFWDWRRREGSYVVSYLGEQYASLTETLRTDFRYNRPDIDEVARAAYESDLMIHVETPPEGHRWLVKSDGGRKLGELEYPPPAVASGTSAAPTGDPGPAAEDPDASLYGGRRLADVHAFSTHASLSLGSFGNSDDGFDLYPGIVVTDEDLFDRGYQAFLGFFLEEAIVSLGKPNAFGRGKRQNGVFLTAQLLLPYSTYLNRQAAVAGGSFRDLRVGVHEPTLSLSLGIPISRTATLGASYRLRDLSFEAEGSTDPGFVLPRDTLEHEVGLSLDLRWRNLSTSIGWEAGWRPDWRPWGLAAAEPVLDAYQVFRWRGEHVRRIGEHQSLSSSLTYWKGNDLDRFSRLRNGRTRDRLVGFRSNLAFDEAVHLSLVHRFHLLHRWPMDLRLDGGRQWLDDEPGAEPRDFVGASLRFLVHGPLRLDVWPSISYGLYSSVPGEAGHTTLGLTLARRR